MQFGLHREAVWRRGVDDREVPGPHQGELQGSRDRGGCEGQCVDIYPQPFHFFLGCNPEFLLLVNDQQTEILKLYVFPKQPVGPDKDIDFPFFEVP